MLIRASVPRPPPLPGRRTCAPCSLPPFGDRRPQRFVELEVPPVGEPQGSAVEHQFVSIGYYGFVGDNIRPVIHSEGELVNDVKRIYTGSGLKGFISAQIRNVMYIRSASDRIEGQYLRI